jgi:hypothetical protein
VRLAERRAHEALVALREAAGIWRDLDAPFEMARVTVLVGRACQALGDADGARMEWDAAARVFRQFGAAPALDALVKERSPSTRPEQSGLSPRGKVLRLIARGD